MKDFLSGKSVAITGGCGFIGSHLAERLSGMGLSRLVLLDSMAFGRRENIWFSDAGVEIAEHRLGAGSYPYLKDLLQGVDLVFHLAAEKHNQSIGQPEKVLDANVQGTFDLLRAASDNQVTKVVFTSSLYACGRMVGAPMSEEEAPQPKTVYGVSKLAGEGLCRHFSEVYGLPAYTLRLFFVYGSRQFSGTGYKSVIVKNFERMLEGRAPVVFGDGNQTLDYIHISDILRALLIAAQPGLPYDVVNIGTGNGMTINALTEIMSRVAGSDLVPEFGEQDATHGTSRVAETDKAARLLSFTAETDLEEGLKETFAWLREQKSQKA